MHRHKRQQNDAPTQLSLFQGLNKKPPLTDAIEGPLSKYDFSLLKPRQHPLRPYQEDAIVHTHSNKNAIIVLGTNTGKTEIGFHLAAEALKRGKVLFVADTVLLCEQHYKDATSQHGFDLGDGEVVLAVGDNYQRKKDPAALYDKARLVIGTPETIVRDLQKGLLDMREVSLVILDEVHHTQGNDDYAKVVDAAISVSVPRVGFSASPAESRRKLQDLIDTMQVVGDTIFVGKDEEIEKYVSRPAYIKVFVELEGERHRALTLLSELGGKLFKEMISLADKIRFHELKNHYGSITKEFRLPRFKEMNEGKRLIDRARGKASGYYSEKSKTLYTITSYHAAIYKLVHQYHAFERIGSLEFLAAAKKLDKDHTKAAAMIRKSALYQECKKIASALGDHPKTDAVLRLLDNNGGQAMVFVETQQHARRLAQLLNDAGIPAHELMGKKGMSSKKQAEVRELFENGEIRVIVATSVANEGLHLPSIKIAINYSAPLSTIGDLQRSGRVRDKYGKVYTLIGCETSDVSLFYAAQARKKSLKNAYAALSPAAEGQEPAQGELLV